MTTCFQWEKKGTHFIFVTAKTEVAYKRSMGSCGFSCKCLHEVPLNCLRWSYLPSDQCCWGLTATAL